MVPIHQLLVAAVLTTTSTSAYWFPSSYTNWDYQLSSGYQPQGDNVTIVVRDRDDEPIPGMYNICYINRFQTQSDRADIAAWTRLGVNTGVTDSEWPEYILDIRSKRKRARIARRLVGFMKGCKAKGFQAIEIDNMDTALRTEGQVSTLGLNFRRHTVPLLKRLIRAAHSPELDMAIGQKNSAEVSQKLSSLGFDFAIAESCHKYDECGEYTQYYGTKVLRVEYPRALTCDSGYIRPTILRRRQLRLDDSRADCI